MASQRFMEERYGPPRPRTQPPTYPSLSTENNAPPSTPARLLEARRLYKTSTNVALEWLVKHGSTKSGKNRKADDGNEKIFTVNEILSCAESISNRKMTAPTYIRSAFRTALINRRRMTAWFRENELGYSEETSKHQFFTDTFQKAFSTLFPEDLQSTAESSSDVPDAEGEELFKNTFGPLEDVPTEKVSTLTEKEIQEHLNSWAEATAKPRFTIADDPFDEIFQFHQYFLEMDYIVATLKEYWEEVAQGTMPVALAAWLTTAGYYGVKKVCERYQDEVGLSHRDLMTKVMGKKNDLQIATGEDLSRRAAERSGHDPVYKEISSGYALLTPMPTLRDWKFDKQMDAGTAVRVKPTDLLLEPDVEKMMKIQQSFDACHIISNPMMPTDDLPESEKDAIRANTAKYMEPEIKCFDSVTRSMCQILDDPLPEPFMDWFNPMLPEMTHWLRSDFMAKNLTKKFDRGKITWDNMGQHSNAMPRTELIFGLTLLLETGKSFVWKDGKANPVNLRLKAPQLMNEVKKCIKQRIDQEVEAGESRNLQPQTVNALHEYFVKLDYTSKKVRFDLYYQLPWTAGSQISETLQLALETGMAVCSTRSLLGQVLHAYNMVRQVAPKKTRRLPLMEQLCDFFKDQVFMGERHKSRFQSVLFRFMDGKLTNEYSTSKKEKKTHRSNFQIGVPKGLQDGAKDSARLNAQELSLWYDLRHTQPPFNGNGTLWSRVFTGRRLRNVPVRQVQAMEAQMHDVPFALTLEKLKSAALSDFTGEFPIAKINFFQVYDLACEVLGDIARRYQKQFPEEMWPYKRFVQQPPADACAGSSFVAILVQDVDGVMERRGKVKVGQSEGHGGVELVWDALEKCVGDKKVEEFFWRSL